MNDSDDATANGSSSIFSISDQSENVNANDSVSAEGEDTHAAGRGVRGKDILLEEGEMFPIREGIDPVAGEEDLPFYFGEVEARAAEQAEETVQKHNTDRRTSF